jgi:PAS domain S-box-containing protein
MPEGTDPAVHPITDQVLRRVVDRLPSMLAYWDKDLRCRFANQAYEVWFGVRAEQLIGTSIRDLLGPQLFALNEPHIRAALGGQEQTFERSVPGPGGTRRDSLAHYMPDIVDGRVAGFVAQVTEITGLKAAQVALRRSEQRFWALAEASPFAVYQTDPQGRCTYANARWRDISGRPLEAILGLGWLDALHPDDRDTVFAARQRAATEGREFERTYRIVRPDGAVRLVRSRAGPLPALDPGGGGLVGALEDVTEQVAAEQRLRASESFLDQTGRIANVGGWALDLRSRSVTWSAQTRRIHEVDDDYVPTVADGIQFYAPEARPLIEAAVERGFRDGTPWDLELPLITAKGRRIRVRAFGEVEREAGLPVRLIGAFQDVTEQYQRRMDLQREQTLRLQTQQHAEALDRLLHERGEMLDVMAHEVRQPLNNASAALQGAAATLRQLGEQTASQSLTRAQTVLSHVLASIDNTLAVASLLARPDPIQRGDTDIDTLLAVSIADMPERERARIQVERVTSTRTASMDMSLLRLALRNLLSNALKCSAATAPVTIRLSDSDVPLALVIEVIDRGTGIAPQRVPTLFERGANGGASGGPGAGMGLGLYIVRRVMELHGGQAELAANSAQGVTMRLVLTQTMED